MLTTREMRSVKVYRKPKPGKEFTKDGLPRRGHKIGKIFKTVFDPSGMRVVGFIVRQPDLLWMFKRPEKFLALDAMEVDDGVARATMGGKSWDDAAIKRMGIDYDKCIIWEGMPVKTTEGEEIGTVDEISFDENTGEIASFFLDDGGVARALVGALEIPTEMVKGYRAKDGLLEVLPEAGKSTRLTGGLAAKAGTATAKVQISAKEGAHKAGKAAGKAAEKGAEGVGKAIGRVQHMVTDTRDAFNDASGKAEEREAAAKKASGTSSSAKSSSTKKTTSASAKATSSTTKKKTASTAKASSSSEGKGKDAAAVVGEHLKGATTMFSSFKKEFDKASKGE